VSAAGGGIDGMFWRLRRRRLRDRRAKSHVSSTRRVTTKAEAPIAVPTLALLVNVVCLADAVND
jgi:hypothetical protein